MRRLEIEEADRDETELQQSMRELDVATAKNTELISNYNSLTTKYNELHSEFTRYKAELQKASEAIDKLKELLFAKEIDLAFLNGRLSQIATDYSTKYEADNPTITISREEYKNTRLNLNPNAFHGGVGYDWWNIGKETKKGY